MWNIVLAFGCGFLLCFFNCAFVIFAFYKRVQELEKFTLVDKNIDAYHVINPQEPHKKTKEEIALEEIELKEAEFRRILMQDNISEEDIKKYGIREPII